VQELRQWQREWREENRAKTFSFMSDRRPSAEEEPSTPLPDIQNTTDVDDNVAEVPPQTEDTEEKPDDKEIQHTDDMTSPSVHARLESTCCS